MNPIMKEYSPEIDCGAKSSARIEETIRNTLQSTELQKPDLADRASAKPTTLWNFAPTTANASLSPKSTKHYCVSVLAASLRRNGRTDHRGPSDARPIATSLKAKNATNAWNAPIGMSRFLSFNYF